MHYKGYAMIEYYRFYEVEKLINQGKFDQALVELRSLQKLYIELAQENAKLRVQLHDLEDVLSISRNIIFDGDAYWIISGGQKQGPFCPRCYHENGDLIRMNIEKRLDAYDKSIWTCPHCQFTAEPEIEIDTAQAPAPKAKIIPFMQ